MAANSLPNGAARLFRRVAASLLSAAAACLGYSAHAAGPLVLTNGFSAPAFTGALEDHPDWQKMTAGTGTTTATLVPDPLNSANQTVLLSRGSNSLGRWGVPNLPSRFPPSVPTGRFALVEWDMLAQQSSTTTGAFGPFLGVEAYGANGGFSLLASFGVDATTGELLYQEEGSGFFVAPGRTTTFNQWQKYQMLLDYQTHQFRLYHQGTFFAVDGFVDGALNALFDAEFSAIQAGSDAASLNQTGSAYLDNFAIYDAIPGDFSQDGDVDAGDLSTWIAAFGLTGAADATNPDNDSDGADLLIWQRRLGTNFAVPPSEPAAIATPEPAACGLAFAAAALATLHRRRRYIASV